MRLPLLLAAALLTGAPAARAQEDAGQIKGATLLDYCRATTPGLLTTCDMAIFGIVVMHGIDQEMGRAQKLFCVPSDTKPPELRAAVIQKLAGQTALLEQLFTGAVVVALAKAYPCRT